MKRSPARKWAIRDRKRMTTGKTTMSRSQRKGPQLRQLGGLMRRHTTATRAKRKVMRRGIELTPHEQQPLLFGVRS